MPDLISFGQEFIGERREPIRSGQEVVSPFSALISQRHDNQRLMGKGNLHDLDQSGVMESAHNSSAHPQGFRLKKNILRSMPCPEKKLSRKSPRALRRAD
jgi:hypothetical protein